MSKRSWFVTVFILVLCVAFALLNFAYKSVTIYLENESIPLSFWGTRVQDSIKAAQISLRQGDFIKPDLQVPIKNKQPIKIIRANWVSISNNHDIITRWTTERIPQELLSVLPPDAGVLTKVKYKDMIVDPDVLIHNLDQSFPLEIQPITTINLNDSGKERTIQSSSDTLMDALWVEGIRLLGSDLITLDVDTQLVGDEIDVKIFRSKEVTINTKNQLLQTRVAGEKIIDALIGAGVIPQGLDYSIPKGTDRIPDNGQIQLVKVEEDVIIEQDSIPFGLQYVPLADIDLDSHQVVQTGEYGILAKIVRFQYEHSVEISRDMDNEWIAKESKPRIIGYGTNIIINSVDTPKGTFQYYRTVDAYATSYSPCRIGVPDKCSSITASGIELRKGVIGVIRSWYNTMKGANVYIPGYGLATIEDIGAGFPDRNWVDLGFSDEDWVSWSSYVTVYFLTPIPSNIMYILN